MVVVLQHSHLKTGEQMGLKNLQMAQGAILSSATTIVILSEQIGFYAVK
jgi:hypothetical protein